VAGPIPTPQPPPARQRAGARDAAASAFGGRRLDADRSAPSTCLPAAPRGPGATASVASCAGWSFRPQPPASLILCAHVILVIPYPGCARERARMGMMIDECGLVLEQDAMLRQGSRAPQGLWMLVSPQKPDPAHGTAPAGTPAQKADAWHGE
jgi:hypothetical protein